MSDVMMLSFYLWAVILWVSGIETSRFSRLFAASLLVALAALAGCAGLAGGGATPEERVLERAQQRWDLVLAGDIEGAYQFLSPGQRSAFSLENYQFKLAQARVRWLSAEAQGATCGEEVCTARIEVGIRLVSPAPGVRNFEIDRPVEERWVKVNGEWWFVPD